MGLITAELLRQQDDLCSAAVANFLRDNEVFRRLAISEGEMIIRRDKEDDEKLAVGIGIARAKGILTHEPVVAAPRKISVAGRTAREVTDEIARHLPGSVGNVIVIQGLSGTGKGTTVARLRERLPRCVAWSNGNVFRSYTYLCRELIGEGREVRPELLTPELLRRVEQQVTFEEVGDGKYDIVLKQNMRVADIQNTLLKAPEISSAVPTVAQQTQGEVIRFAAAAVEKLKKANYNVILEGRSQTLNYIATDLRFELVIDNVALLGERRAAQRIMAATLAGIKDKLTDATDDFVEDAVLKALNTL